MKITLLGTGTSQGIPVIGCHCEVCTSDDPRDKRLRTAAMITSEDTNLIIDVGPDFRQQMLRHSVQNLSAVFITHEHNDHVVGLDDIRPFYFRQKSGIRFYTTEQVHHEVARRFPYVFTENPYPGAPRVQINYFKHNEYLNFENLKILPLKVLHGSMVVTAFRINDFLYVTDASSIPRESLQQMHGVKVLVINALRLQEHHSHFNLQQALEIIALLKPEKAYLTHLSHYMGKAIDVEKLLPRNVNLGYDDLQIFL